MDALLEFRGAVHLITLGRLLMAMGVAVEWIPVVIVIIDFEVILLFFSQELVLVE
jgi:hypothetical protein